MVSAIIVAGGKGTRMGAGKNKVFLPLLGKEIISRTIAVFESSSLVDEIIIVTASDDIPKMREIIWRDGYKKVARIAEGGAERSDSVYNGLMLATGDISLIHDGARCLVTKEEIEAVIVDTIYFESAALGVKVKDTLKTIDKNGNIVSTVDREKTVHIQTPQGFNTAQIRDLHECAKKENIAVTDDCSIFEHYGKTVHLTEGSYDNIKITTPEDIAVAESILKRKETV